MSKGEESMTAAKQIKFLKKNINKLLIIHYSCETLDDNNAGLSPRVSSIAILQVNNLLVHSFSIHLTAEIKKISREDIMEHFDELEKEMLEDFYAYVKSHENYYWLHWNMENVVFGFQALEHRYRVLTGNLAPKISDSKKYALASLISSVYGKNYVDHPRMLKLMELNGGIAQDFLSGADEFEAFKNREFCKIHKSTMRKIRFFHLVFNRLAERKLKTARSNWNEKLNNILESLPAKTLGLIAVLITITQLFYCIYIYIS